MGPITVAAFGSVSKGEAERMHERINNMYMTAYERVHPSEGKF